MALFATGLVQLQAQDLKWVKSMGARRSDRGNDVVVDGTGNVYTIALFRDTVDFDPGPGVFNLISAGYDNVAIQKLDVNGNLVWVKQFAGSTDLEGTCIALDPSGNVYTGGFFFGTTDFNPGAASFNMSPVGVEDAFICKLDASGNFVWAKQFGGVDEDKVQDLAVNANGDVYSTGFFFQTVDFDPGPATHNLTADAEDVFINKLDRNGNWIWTRQISGALTQKGNSIQLDANGNPYLTGIFEGSPTFSPGAGSITLHSDGDLDVFVAKYFSNGDCAWARQLAGRGIDQGKGIDVSSQGSVWLTGDFTDNLRWIGPGPSLSLKTKGGTDAFVCKIDSLGALQFIKQLAGNSTQEGDAIVTDDKDAAYITGGFRGQTDFDPDEITKDNLMSTGARCMYVWKLDAAGQLAWARKFDGPNFNRCKAVAVDNSKNVITAGAYESTVDFDPGQAVFNQTSVRLTDIFVHKMRGSNGPYFTETPKSPQKTCKGGSGNFAFKVIADNIDNVNIKTSNPAIIPVANIALTDLGDGAYEGTYTTVSGPTGDCTISITLTDQQGEDAEISFLVQVYVPTVEIVSRKHNRCKGESQGTLTALGGNGVAPYSYSWNTNPVQTTATASGLAAGTYRCMVLDSNQCAATSDTANITEPATGMTASILFQTPTGCTRDKSGSATVSVTGGVGTVRYSWNTVPQQTQQIATNMSAGDYICTASDDNNCSIRQLVTIVEQFKFITETSQKNEPCKGDTLGEATAIVKEGSASCVFSWNTATPQTTATISNLAPGSYTCTIADPSSGCINTETVTITEPSKLTTTLVEKMSPTCKDNGSIYIIGKGGTAPYTYSWNTSPKQTSSRATGLGAGTFICLVTDNNGCQQTSAAVSLAYEKIRVERSLVICQGDTLRQGTSKYTTAGTYTDLLKTADDCDSLVITHLLVTSIDNSVNVTDKSVIANTSNAIYQWYDCKTGFPIFNAKAQNYNPTKNGEYSVNITLGSCSTRSACYAFSTTSGISEQQETVAMELYPNPASTTVSIRVKAAGRYSIRNELGQELQNIDLSSGESLSIDLQDWPSGLYYLISTDGISRKKLVVLK